MITLLLAVLAGTLIGLSLGALGGGGSILAVPVLVYLLHQSASQATTGALVVVGVTSLTSAVIAHRAGNVKLARGVSFGVVAIGGAAAGATASSLVSEPVLLACFAALMLLVAAMMIVRQVRHAGDAPQAGGTSTARPALDAPIISVVGERDPATQLYEERFKEWRFLTDTSALVVLDEGGHFAAFEQPELFVDELRAAFRQFR